MTPDPVAASGRSVAAKRWLALALLLAGVVAAAIGFGDEVRLETLRRHQDDLLAFVDANPVLASLAYMVSYAALVAVSMPGAGALTLAGGFLFGWLEGSVYVLVAQSLGATAVFLIARMALRDLVLARAGPRLRALRRGFRDNALSYLIALRVSGLFPALIVNGLPGALDIPLRTYVIATVIGLIPGTLVYASAGAGLGEVLEGRGDIGLEDVLTPRIVLSLLCLAVLALLPVVYHRYRVRYRVRRVRRRRVRAAT